MTDAYDDGVADGRRWMAATVADRLGEIVADSPHLTKEQIMEQLERLRQDMRSAR